MKLKCVWEHNKDDSILWFCDYIGAYTRGESFEAAAKKAIAEIESYCTWAGIDYPRSLDIDVIENKPCDLAIADADSDVIFDSEKAALTAEEYRWLKDMALKSASDFLRLYNSVPDKEATCLSKRKTFYGDVPITANEMYHHTKNVNAYYFGEIGVDADNSGDIYSCRLRGFELLEQDESFLENPPVVGSYGEEWSLRKVLRRFIWHDRIHAKAMYKMAVKTFGADAVENVFGFKI